MQNKSIRDAYQRIQPSQADKDRMLRNLLAAAPRKKAPAQPRYQKRYAPPKRSSVLGPLAAMLALVVLSGGALLWLSQSREKGPGYTQPSESQTVPTGETTEPTVATSSEPTQAELALYARALWEHPDFSSEILSFVQGQPESTSTHHVYTFYDWNQDGTEELLIGLWNGNYAYRGSNESITHEVRMEDGPAVVYPFTGNEHSAYLCQGGVWEDVSLRGCQLLPVDGGDPVLKIAYDEIQERWYNQSEDPNGTPLEAAEKDQLLEGYPHLKLDWQHIIDFPGLRELAEQKADPSTVSFSDLQDLKFITRHLWADWGTALAIHADGSFQSNFVFHQEDTGPDYPKGTEYFFYCTGKLTQPTKVNDYTYAFQAKDIKLTVPEGTEEIRHGLRYLAQDPGFDDTEFYLYLPGTPISELPDNARRFIVSSFQREDDLLTFYALYNPQIEIAFFTVSNSIWPSGPYHKELTYLETLEAELRERLETDPNLTQADMNDLSMEIYRLWDDHLNHIWSDLENFLEENAMKELRERQRLWIFSKEEQVQSALGEYAGGSLSGMAGSLKAAELTKTRVYELVDTYFPEI